MNNKFIYKAKLIHGNKYDYSKTEYINAHTKVCITCLEHGEFWQTPNSHLNGSNCPKCSLKLRLLKRSLGKDEFIKKAKKIHGDKYDYSKICYVNAKTKICITCPEHGEFWQTPDSHLRSNGCPECVGLNKSNTKNFIYKARKIHDNKYDYSKVNYINAKTKVCITCSIHGEFWQTPNHHLNANGCPKCKESKLEKEVRNFLISNNITYETQKQFEWLGRQKLDFYLPDYNVAIECQGRQHFKPVNYFGGNKGFEMLCNLDLKKYNLCKENNIDIFYFTNKRGKKECNSYHSFLYTNMLDLCINFCNIINDFKT